MDKRQYRIIDCTDDELILEAMKSMKPGDRIEIRSNGNSLTVGIPSLEESELPPPQAGRPPTTSSWLD
ncbi:MAG: hypothetical protein IH991_03210 [Planctomycetes bacterium]|nr:hypothetical protein [Planctomycetota bacterium]